MARRPSLALVASILAALVPATAGAQTRPSIDTSTWRPSIDPQAGLVLEPVGSPGPFQLNVGAWTSYAHAPVVLRDAASGQVVLRPVAHAVTTDLVAGVGLGERAALGIDVPVLLWQDSAGTLPPTVTSTGSVPRSGLGDLAIVGKGTLVANDRQGVSGGFGLAAVGAVTLPTGDPGGFHGEGSTTVSLRVLGEYALGVGAVRATLGYAVRTTPQTWPDASAGGSSFGDTIPWSLGFTVRPKALLPALDSGDRQSWEVAAHGWVPAGPAAPFGLDGSSVAPLSPALLGASDRVQLGHYRDAFVLLGAEVGLDTAVGVPAFRGVLAIGWAPRAHDRDGDGVPDERDECPDLAEDLDGIQDEDGCPEDDADGDGILDPQDACPLEPGVWWNDPAKNGCPAPDTDGDGIPDPVDACPAVKGAPSPDPKKNGCPPQSLDRDHDGVPDDADRCPDQPEDRDGFEDFDGCPDPDNDGDGIPDVEDACPGERGDSREPGRSGCPDPDRDGDTFDNDVDQCPDQAEVWNGVKDDDGCPDEGGKALVEIARKGDAVALVLARPLQVTGSGGSAQLDPKSEPTLRAVATELARHPGWTLGVGARPGPGKPEDAQREAIERAMVVATRLGALAHRPTAVEAVAWDAVKQQPGASGGIGLVVLGPGVSPK